MSTNIIKHNFSTDIPQAHEVAVGELVLQLFRDKATLYTKSLNGEIIELGKGVLNFEDLSDIDLTNVREGSFIIKQGNKFIASNFIGSIGNLSDVEISNPQAGDYVRYDPVYLSFRNFKPSYNLFQLLDVDVANPTSEVASQAMHDQTLYYDHPTQTFKTRARRHLINQLDDVAITLPDHNQLLQRDVDGIWKNMDLHIIHDTSPSLGGNLNANGNQILHSSYKLNTVVCNTPTVTISYADGDYWILQGVPIGTNEQCIVNIDFTSTLTNTVAILMLEIRQDTGGILLGGLLNIQYEDGRPLQLSGAGKTDIITITVKKVGSTYTTFITPTALNVATVGQGGIAAYRYDKNRYPEVQQFAASNLYDDYFDYVQLLLNFEAEQSTGRLWYEDKSESYHTVTTSTTQKPIDVYTFGLREYVADFLTTSNAITLTASTTITLEAGFTLECFINHPLNMQYLAPNMEHILFTNNDNTLKLSYFSDAEGNYTYLRVKIRDTTYVYHNAYNYFRDKNNKYVHIAVVRNSALTEEPLRVYVDGVKQLICHIETGILSVLGNVVINTGSITGFQGLLNTLRISSCVRYIDNFQIPAMRFGLVGGALDILDAQVFDTYAYMDKELEYNIFC